MASRLDRSCSVDFTDPAVITQQLICDQPGGRKTDDVVLSRLSSRSFVNHFDKRV